MVIISACTFVLNVAKNGAALHIGSASVNISDCGFDRNTYHTVEVTSRMGGTFDSPTGVGSAIYAVSGLATNGMFSFGEVFVVLIHQPRIATTNSKPAVVGSPVYSCNSGTSFTNFTYPYCEVCASGKYSLQEELESSCQPCAPGEYQDLFGQSSCSSCGPGRFSDGIQATACKECPPGKHGATSLPFYVCQECPSGQYQQFPSQNDCTLCPAGVYGATSGLSSSNCSGTCPSGTECPPGVSSATPLLPGYAASTREEAGGGWFIEQTKCRAGFFCLSGVEAACPQEKYSLAGSPFCDSKQPCTPGTYESNAWLSGPERCILCVAGTYSSASNAPSCKACEMGKYQSVSAQTFCVAHAQCSAGQRVLVVGSATAAGECADCLAGSFSGVANVASCTTCSDGQFQDKAGKTYCIDHASCSAGTRIDTEGTSSTNRSCTPCDVGTFSDIKNMVTCTVCISGQFQDQAGRTNCIDHTSCAAGMHVDTEGASASNRNCTPCGVGTFSGTVNSPSCTDCPSGKYQLSTGQPYCDTKQPCNPGTYEADSSSSSPIRCILCPAGRISTDTNVQSCTACKSGTYQTERGKRVCNEVSNMQFVAINAQTGEAEPQTCPEPTASGHGRGATCDGGIVEELPGFWRDPGKGSAVTSATQYYRCPQAHACLSGANCSQGHRGVLCAVCDREFAMTMGACLKCPGPAKAGETAGMVLGVLAAIAACGWVFHKRGGARKIKKALVSESTKRRSKSLFKVLCQLTKSAVFCSCLTVTQCPPPMLRLQSDFIQLLEPW
jgi:hypothetical protein